MIALQEDIGVKTPKAPKARSRRAAREKQATRASTPEIRQGVQQTKLARHQVLSRQKLFLPRPFLQKIRNAWEAYQLNRAERVAINQLMQLDDYLLRDMGLCRDDLVEAKRNRQLLDEIYRKNQNC